MTNPIINDPIAMVAEAFEALHPGVKYEVAYAPDIRDGDGTIVCSCITFPNEEDGPDAVPTYKGVVFNEMKGAMSSPDRMIWDVIGRNIFPDTTYGVNSGGDPDVIPELTYEQFIAMYKRYYHPSNSRIFLDGAVPLDRVLPLIDS